MKAWKRLGVCVLFSLLVLSLPQNSFAGPQNFDGDTTEGGEALDDLTLFDASTGTFQIRKSSDSTVAQVVVSDGFSPAGNVPAPLDYNGDGTLDPSTFNRSNGKWIFSVDGTISTDTFSDGTPGNIPVPGNYYNNSRDDLGVYNPLTQTWWTKNTQSGAIEAKQDTSFGRWPIVGDFDADGTDDMATWDPSTGTWYIYESSTQAGRTLALGLSGDIPMAADFDGDGDDDPVVFRPFQLGSLQSVFFVANPNDAANPWAFPWGLPGDFPTVLDTVGSGKTDISVFRASLASFFVRTALGFDWPQIAVSTFAFANAALPLTPNQFVHPVVPGDANRDGRSDFAVTLSSGASMQWNWLLLSGDLIQYLFGLKDDIALTGDLDGDKTVQPVVVRENGGFLDWHARLVDGQGALLFSQFGIADDIPLLGDLDCDGKDEPIVVRNLGGNLFWFWLNSSSSWAGAFNWAWGLEGDTPFVADTNGDGCDELLVSRESGGGVLWLGFSPRTARTTTAAWGLAGDIPFPPADFSGDGVEQPIVIREVNGQRVAFVHGSTLAFNLGSSGTPAVGNFTGTRKSQFALYVSGGNPGTDTAVIYLLSGLTATYGLGQSPGRGTVVAPLVTPGEGNALGCSQTTLFFRPELYKPFSDAVPGHGVVLFDDNVWNRLRSLEFFDRDNNFIGSDIRRKCCPNGGRAHFWLPVNSVSLLPIAPITVKVTLDDGSTLCRSIPNPTQRYE